MAQTRAMRRLFPFLLLGLSSLACADGPAFHLATCDGDYPRHVQGICTDGKDALYWSWTDVLVKTDADGRLLKQVPVADHHGDLCYHAGRVYVAVNLGKFNRPAGEADSWVYVYDGNTLAELAKHPVPELVHGAGGIAWHDGKFIVVGGLPAEIEENYLVWMLRKTRRAPACGRGLSAHGQMGVQRRRGHRTARSRPFPDREEHGGERRGGQKETQQGASRRRPKGREGRIGDRKSLRGGTVVRQRKPRRSWRGN